MSASVPVAAQTTDTSVAAVATSWSLRADEARQDGADARLRGAYDSFMPTVALTADKPLTSRITYSPQPSPTVVGYDTAPVSAPTNVAVTVDLPLLDGLRRWNTLGSAQALAQSGRFLSASRRQQVLLDASAAYLAVVRDTRVVRARDAQIETVRRIRDATARQFAVADATRTDVALARSRFAEAESSRDRALADLAASRLELQRLTRTEPDRLLPPRIPAGLPRDERGFAELVRSANPGLAASRLDVRSAEYQAEAAASAFLPQVNFQFSHSKVLGYSPVLDRINDTTARLVARLPIYEPGAFPRLQEASAAARQRGFEAQDEELATLTSARTAFARRKAIVDQVARLAARVVELRQTETGYEIERAAGFRTVLDELNIRAELAAAEILLAAVETERDQLTLQMAAAGNLLDESGVRGGRRFASIASAARPATTAGKPARVALRGSVSDPAAVRLAEATASDRPDLRPSQDPATGPR